MNDQKYGMPWWTTLANKMAVACEAIESVLELLSSELGLYTPLRYQNLLP